MALFLLCSYYMRASSSLSFTCQSDDTVRGGEWKKKAIVVFVFVLIFSYETTKKRNSTIRLNVLVNVYAENRKIQI